MTEYNNFEYLWPPRPAKAVPPAMLGVYEKMGFQAQTKKNGTCSIIAISPDKEITAMNRHNELHKAWAPDRKKMQSFLTLPGKGWYVFVAELLHNKVTGGPRDVNYIFDILVNDGQYLVGTTQLERNELLQTMFTIADQDDEKLIIDPYTWIAKNRIGNFKTMFQSTLTQPENEGIVLKNPKALLTFCSRQAANSEWQVKCRKSHSNYNS